MKKKLGMLLAVLLIFCMTVGVFADAGNVWLMNEDPERPGGKF